MSYTYRVMDNQGNTLNHVQVAEKEQGHHTVEQRNELRKAEATKKLQRWAATLFPTESLQVVACQYGKPINTPIKRHKSTETNNGD